MSVHLRARQHRALNPLLFENDPTSCKILNMSSLEYKFPRWFETNHPIFWMETRRRAGAGMHRSIRYAMLPAILLAVESIIFLSTLLSLTSVPFPDEITIWGMGEFVTLGLTMAFVLLLIIQVAFGGAINLVTVALAAPLISGELELKSWELLRATTLTLREILLAKLSATLHQLRPPLLGLMIIRAISTSTGMLLFYFISLDSALSAISYGNINMASVAEEWLPIAIALTSLALVLLVQPPIQMIVNILLGMLASAYTQSRSRALAIGLGLRVALWGITIVAGSSGLILTTTLYNRWRWDYLAPPEHPQLVTAALSIGWALVFLLAQLVTMFGSWKLMMRRARRLTEAG